MFLICGLRLFRDEYRQSGASVTVFTAAAAAAAGAGGGAAGVIH